MRDPFKSSVRPLLSIFFTAGYPRLNDTASIALLLDKCGVDFIEVGIPFSDPVADGPVIQQTSQKALENGMNMALLFEQISEIREQSDIPIYLMGYFNPILRFGIEKFCKLASKDRVNGVILPDLPLSEYQRHYQNLFKEYGLQNILLISPQTSPERIKQIDEIATSFIYMVSTSATTGGGLSESPDTVGYFKRIKAMQLKNPKIIGFGVRDKASFEFAGSYADGAIIGTAFVKQLETGDIKQVVPAFINSIRGSKEKR